MRKCILLPMILCLLALPFAASADQTTETTETTETTVTQAVTVPLQKTLSVELIDGAGRLVADVQQYTFWEHPQVAGGGRHLPGTLTIRNNTANDATVCLHRVDLPYNNEQALTYLAALQLTVSENGQILYQGSYAAVNESELMGQEFVLEAGQQREWEITLTCPFSYADDPSQVSVPCEWEIYAVASTQQTTLVDVQKSVSDETVSLVLIGAGAVLAICLVAALVYYIRKGKG